MKRVHVIGIAPGQKTLPGEVMEIIGAADILIGASRLLALAPAGKAERMTVEHRVSEAVDRVVSSSDLKAVFLASGDPSFFGIGALLTRKLSPDEIEIIPAVSSLQAAFAKIGQSWSDARFASLHGRSFDNLLPLLGAGRVGLLTDPENTPAKIALFLADAGWGDLEMAVCSELGEESEKIERGAVSDFTAWTGPSLNVVLLINKDGDKRPLGPGIPDEEFLHPRGRITKALVRASALALLNLPRTGVLWDIGAGSGSVSIEASLLSPALRVYAVEKDAEALGHAAGNRKKFRAAAVTIVEGEAPEPLAALPPPDRVFIGGSGGRLEEILTLCNERLPEGGVTVVSTVLAETFQTVIAWAKSNDIAADWSEVRVSRSRPTGAGTRLAAQDPVTLIRIVKGKRQ